MTMSDSRTCALFISDVHLQPSHARTSQAFFEFLETHAMATRALYLLGDLFDYWAGDDDIGTPFQQQVIEAIRRVSDAGVAVYWIAGNRDFLVGRQFALASGATLLAEPFLATVGKERIVLVHGDAQCTDDIKYMQFRAMVRSTAWQQQFLALPLAQRKTIIAGLRKNSVEEQSGKSYQVMDVTPEAVKQLFAESACTVMIHGHTHRPALHRVDATRRYVLPDWDLDATVARGGWIAVAADGAIERHHLDGSLVAD